MTRRRRACAKPAFIVLLTDRLRMYVLYKDTSTGLIGLYGTKMRVGMCVAVIQEIGYALLYCNGMICKAGWHAAWEMHSKWMHVQLCNMVVVR